MKFKRVARIKRCLREYDMSFNSPTERPYYFEESLIFDNHTNHRYWSSPRGFFSNVADLEAYRQNETKVTAYRVCIWHEECGEIRPQLIYVKGVE